MLDDSCASLLCDSCGVIVTPIIDDKDILSVFTCISDDLSDTFTLVIGGDGCQRFYRRVISSRLGLRDSIGVIVTFSECSLALSEIDLSLAIVNNDSWKGHYLRSRCENLSEIVRFWFLNSRGNDLRAETVCKSYCIEIFVRVCD